MEFPTWQYHIGGDIRLFKKEQDWINKQPETGWYDTPTKFPKEEINVQGEVSSNTVSSVEVDAIQADISYDKAKTYTVAAEKTASEKKKPTRRKRK